MGVMVRNADGTFTVSIDPNAGNITLPWTARVQAPLTADQANERYAEALSKAYLETLATEYEPNKYELGEAGVPVAKKPGQWISGISNEIVLAIAAVAFVGVMGIKR